MGDGPPPESWTKLTVSFDIIVGEVWVDPDGAAWVVKSTVGGDVFMERNLVERVKPEDLVRGWRKVIEGMIYEDENNIGYSTSPMFNACLKVDIPWEVQEGIAQAARHAWRAEYLERSGGNARLDLVKAEDFRNAVGYSDHIDPNDP